MLPETQGEEQLSWRTHLLMWVLLVHDYQSEFLPPHLQDGLWVDRSPVDRRAMRSLRAEMLDFLSVAGSEILAEQICTV